MLLNLTLIQPGSGKSVNYRGPFCFDLAFMRCKLTSPSIWRICIERCGFGNLPRTCDNINKSERPARLRICLPRTLRGPGSITDRNFIDAAPHCGPQAVRTSPALWWSVIAVKPVGSGNDGRVATRQNF